MGAWSSVFGNSADLNRAQRRAQSQKFAREIRRQKRAHAREQRTPKTKKEDD